MIPTILFGLMCLGPLTVMGDNDDSWVPETVPWPAQQCVDRRKGFVGECAAIYNNAWYKSFPACRSLKCALPNNVSGGYAMMRSGMPAEGTICGVFKACHRGYCVDVPLHKIPIQTGIRTVYECGPPLVTPKPRFRNRSRLNSTSAKI